MEMDRNLEKKNFRNELINRLLKGQIRIELKIEFKISLSPSNIFFFFWESLSINILANKEVKKIKKQKKKKKKDKHREDDQE